VHYEGHYIFTWVQAPREVGAAGPPSRAHKGVGGPCTSKLKNEMGSYAQSFYCYSFIYTVLCKLID